MQLSTTGILLLFGFWNDSELPNAETDLIFLDTVSGPPALVWLKDRAYLEGIFRWKFGQVLKVYNLKCF